MLLLDFLPNWRNGVTENREYLTNIMASHDQTEQRAALRSKPRGSMMYSLLLHGADAARFDWLMTAGQAQVLLMPYWPRPSHLRASAAAGDAMVRLDVAPPVWVVPGAFLALLYGNKTSQLVKVESVNGRDVTLAADGKVPGNWPVGALVYPTWEIRMPDAVQVKRHTPTIVETSFTLARQVSTTAEPVPALGPDMLHDGIEVLTRDINWRDGADADLTWLTSLMDGSRGRTAYEVLAKQQQRTSGGMILIKDYADADWWVAFFDRHKGRRGVFFAPSRDNALPLVASPDPAKSKFAVAGTTFHQLAQPGISMMTHLMIRLQTGGYRLFKITSLEADFINDVTYIKTAEPWTQTYRPDQALSHYLASRCRLASDTLSIAWRAAGVGEAKVSVTTVGATW